MLRILSIDPSGTGTTGMFLRNLKKDSSGRYWPISAYSFQHKSDQPYAFLEFKSKIWRNHSNYIFEIVKEWKPDVLLYENTNYINSRGLDMTNLLRLMGALEGFKHTFDFIKQIDSILVGQVKDLKSKLLKGTKKLPELEFKKGCGKGWMFNQKKISLHELDAYLVYWLWKEKLG